MFEEVEEIIKEQNAQSLKMFEEDQDTKGKKTHKRFQNTPRPRKELPQNILFLFCSRAKKQNRN